MKRGAFKKFIAVGVGFTVATSSTPVFSAQIDENRSQSVSLVGPVEIKSAPRTVKFRDGTEAQISTEIMVGTDQKSGEDSFVSNAIREKLGINEKNRESFPIKKLVVVPENADQNSVLALRSYVTHIVPKAGDEISTVRLPEGTFHNWFAKNNNIVYSVIRFVMNGTTTGGALIYSLNVPVASALVIGLIIGSVSGSVQYNIGAYRDWLERDTLLKNFGSHIYGWDDPLKSKLKEFYNNLLSVVEQYGKFGLSEAAFISMARLTMWLMDLPNMPTGFYNNVANVLRTAFQSTMAQGVAELGLFRDLEVQQSNGWWSNDFGEFVRNTSTFFISAASVAVSALQIVRPGFGGVIDFGFFDLPIGFTVVTAVGLGFYLHALFTYWLGNGL